MARLAEVDGEEQEGGTDVSMSWRPQLGYQDYVMGVGNERVRFVGQVVGIENTHGVTERGLEQLATFQEEIIVIELRD